MPALHPSWCAIFGIWLAHAQPAQVSAVVLFYGPGWPNQTNTQASYLGHFPHLAQRRTLVL